MDLKHTTLTSKLDLIRKDYQDFKNKWLLKYVNYPMSRVEKEHIYHDFNSFLIKWDISMEFRFVFKESSIILKPIGITNELALLTITGEG